jgi:hypothetical protein
LEGVDQQVGLQVVCEQPPEAALLEAERRLDPAEADFLSMIGQLCVAPPLVRVFA